MNNKLQNEMILVPDIYQLQLFLLEISHKKL